MEVIGVDGCQPPHKGVIKELSVYEHKILGRLVQVWVEWFYPDYPQGHLEPYSPHQFKPYKQNCGVGIYIS